MSVDGYVSTNIWQSAALVYAGFDVTRIEIATRDEVEFHFENAPSLDARAIVEDYETDCLALTSAKQLGAPELGNDPTDELIRALLAEKHEPRTPKSDIERAPEQYHRGNE